MSDYKNTGDYILKSFTLTSVNGRVIDIRKLFDAFTFVEDIFSNYIYGTINITDSVDLYQSLPLVGGEEVEFSYHTDTESKIITRKLIVYRVSSNPIENDKMIPLTLQVVSKEALVDQNKLISKSFNQIKASDSVSLIFSELSSEKPIDVESTLHLQNSIIPNWSPFQAINWFSTVSLPESGRGSLFLLYEDKDKFNFKTIQKLYNQEPSKKITGSFNRTDKKENRDNFDFGSITNLSNTTSTVDILKSLKEGMFASKVVAYDNVSKESRILEFDYLSEFGEFDHLNNTPLVPSTFEYTDNSQRLSYATTKTFRQESGYYSSLLGSDAFSQRVEDIMPHRSSQLSQSLSRSYEATIAGDSELTCGQVIEVELPTVVDNKELNGSHRYYTENVLITKCVHSFTISQYNCKLSVSSDTYNDNFNEKYKP